MTPEIQDAKPVPETNPVLRDTWQRFARYDLSAKLMQREFFNLRSWILILGIAATTLALLHAAPKPFEAPLSKEAVKTALRYLVILAPVSISVLQGISSKFKGGNNYVLFRSSAEALKKEIYRYRAGVEIYSPAQTATHSKDAKLAAKAKRIAGQLMKTEASQASLKMYQGHLPPKDAAHAQDDGFSPLMPETYIAWRLEHQLNFYRTRVKAFDMRSKGLNLAIYLLGGAGTFLAATGWEVWVVVTTALSGAMVSYLELKRYESVVAIYNQAVSDLESIKLWWHALSDPEKQAFENFEKLVKNTEAVIQSEHVGWVQELREALEELDKPAEITDEE